MIKHDIHFFTADAVPLILQYLQDHGIKIDSHKSVSYPCVRDVESHRPENCVVLKVKYHV